MSGRDGVLGGAREHGRVRQLPDEVGRVGDLAAVAALRREVGGIDGLGRAARDARLVLGRVLGQALELGDGLDLGLRLVGSSSGSGSGSAGGSSPP